MFLREFPCFRSKSLDDLSDSLTGPLCVIPCVEVAQLLSHLPEQSVLESLQLAQTEYFRRILSVRVGRSFDEIEHISLFLLGNFTLRNILEDPA